MHLDKRARAVVAATIATWLGLTASAGAAAVEVKAFRATSAAGEIRYELVICAPLGTALTFRAELTAARRATYILPVLRGRQHDVCPTWSFEQEATFPPGHYRTRVRIGADRHRATSTKRVTVDLP
jgi:hypothetical protein